ncbi:PREDICTED: receptor-like protein 12 [Brassica oleracea var. oleracea]|nr:PREDICTED: receptor-like protein 12 [Brassica oleracea var. oleracea]
MMVGNHCYCFSSIITIFVSIAIHSTLASPRLHFCRHDQRDALLEFMHEFPIDKSFPSSWNKSSDCCFWEGVECHNKSGQVISLDLSDKYLNGSMKTNSSIFKLQYLGDLSLTNCNLQGEIPSSLGNLSRLKYLDLRSNNLVGEVPASMGHLTELEGLSLEKNSLSGSFPSSLANFTKLTRVFLNSNNFTSTLPSDMSGLHNLEWFDISENSFFGPFPKSLFTISSLIIVSLEKNQFTGPIDFENATSSPLFKLEDLVLASNKFDGLIPESISKFLNLQDLDLSRNSFSGPIPRSISKLDDLRHLDFAKNKLEGEVPSCLWNFPTVMLSHNFFSSFENVSQESTDIHRLDLNSNSFRGPFPDWVCKFYRLEYLDLSNNLFSGSIPSCLSRFTYFLMELTLGNNNFSGTLPDIFGDATRLESLDVSRNRLEGNFPKSLIHCKALKHVNVGSNKFKDKFPHWLGSLPSLHVLSLRCNKFFGPLYRRHMSSGFKSLRVMDISHNDFTGTLPPHYFSSWHEMTTLTEEYNQYMESHSFFDAYFDSFPFVPENYESVEMVIKGVEMSFERIRKDFRAIDFSKNRIHGKIPESLCSLKELLVLNLSGNAFTGVIPRSLAKLTKLETLDLSCNKLSGEIPQDLGKLSFLSYMNFSHNHLQGSVPRGTQFQSQNCSSFMDNPELLGLEDICRKPNVLGPTSHQPEEVSESEEPMFNWVAAAIAYGPGVFCGFVIGYYIFTSGYHEWFAERFGRRKIRVVTSVR